MFNIFNAQNLVHFEHNFVECKRFNFRFLDFERNSVHFERNSVHFERNCVDFERVFFRLQIFCFYFLNILNTFLTFLSNLVDF